LLYIYNYIKVDRYFRGYNHIKKKSLKNFENYSEILKLTGLFKGIKHSEIQSLLNSLGAVTHNAGKGKIILLTGDRLDYIGIVLSGHLHITRNSYNGNRSLVASIKQGGIFAEALYCAGFTQSPVTVTAAQDSCIMKLSFARVIETCSVSCNRLIVNMLYLIAGKNLTLQNRMEILELKTIREKVLRYLESFGTRNIALPFNRQEMADFLCVERSALSHELIKMKNDNLLNYSKNKFILADDDNCPEKSALKKYR